MQGAGDAEAGRAASSPELIPLWFGDATRPLFGWYHAPPEGQARDVVAVLCNPFGYDLMIAHYSYRHLAKRLAAAGIGALRFDYFGTGDSAGDDLGPDRLDDWLASVQAARELATRVSGATRTALFGLRFGALMALASAERSPVDALVLLGPPASGKAFVRELRAARKLAAPVPRPSSPDGASGDDENFGFLMDEPTREALSKLELQKLETPPARRALVLARDDMNAGEQALVDRLVASGVDAKLSTTPGYTLALRGDPYVCELPDAAWSEIADDLAASSAKAPDPASIPAARVASPAPGIREEAVMHRGLFGVVTEPETLTSSRAGTAIVLATIAANHHIGSNRMYVRWARHWARLGYRVLRFDQAGIGDSPARPGRRQKEVYAAQAMPEVSEMLDLMASRGCERFVIAGLCSGAYVAFYTALADPRVSGVVLLNQPTFHWKPGDSLEIVSRGAMKGTAEYKSKAFQLETYKRLLRGEVHVRPIAAALATRLARRVQTTAVALGTRAGLLQEPDDVARGFQALSKRGCDVLVLVGSNDGARDTLAGHLGANALKMRDRSGFRLFVYEGTDHVFTPREAQDALEKELTAHLVERFG